MKNINIIITLVILLTGCGKTPADKGGGDNLPGSLRAKMYVSTARGVNLRENPMLNAKVVKVLPRGAMLVIKKSAPAEIEIDGRKGYWVQTDWDGLSGWIFSGYLKADPDLEIFRKHPVGSTLNDDGLVLYEKPDNESRRLAASVHEVRIESIRDEIQIINYTPVRWAEVTVTTHTVDLNKRGWVYSTQLVTNEESLSHAEPADRDILKSVSGNVNVRICRINDSGTFRVFTIDPNPDNCFPCLGYGISYCFSVISEKGKVLFTDYPKESLGYFYKFKGDYAFFYILMGEGDGCSSYSETRTTVVNVRTGTRYRVISTTGRKCIKCIQDDSAGQSCRDNKYETVEDRVYYNGQNQLIRKEDVPGEIPAGL